MEFGFATEAVAEFDLRELDEVEDVTGVFDVEVAVVSDGAVAT